MADRAPERHRFLATPWMVVLVPLVVFANGLLGRANYAIGDGAEVFVPEFLASAKAWSTGHLPTWNPWVQAGMQQLGTVQPGAFYPPNLLFIVLPAVVANNVTIVISFLLAGTGAWLLARLLTDDRVAAAVGGLGFGLCSFLFAHLGHESMIAGAAWMPWMLFTYERLLRRFSYGRLLAMGATIGLAQYAGHSQIFAIDLAVLGAYAVGASALAGGWPKLRPLLLGGAGVLVGLALGAAQLLPSLVVSMHSIRTAYTYASAMTYALPKSHLGLVLFPFLQGNAAGGGPYFHGYLGIWNLTEMTVYPGAALLVLSVAAIPALRRSGSARSLVLVCAACAVMVVGPASPTSHLVFRVPVYGQFRAWARYGSGLQLGVAMLAAWGVAVLRRGTVGERRVALGLCGLGVVAYLGAALVLPRLARVRQFIPTGTPAKAALLVPQAAAVVALACAVGLGWRARWGSRVVAVAVMGVVAADALMFGYFYEWRIDAPAPAAYKAHLSAATPDDWGTPSPASGGLARFMFVGGNTVPMQGNFVASNGVKGWDSVNTNNPLIGADYAAATGQSDFGSIDLTDGVWGPNARLLDLLRVSTVIVDPGSAGGGPPPDSVLGTATPVTGTQLVRYTYQPKLPDAFVVGATLPQTFDQELDAIHGILPFDPSSVALIDAACRACPTGPQGADGSASAVHWGINNASVDVTAPRAGVVVLSQAFSPGWVATVDGHDEPVIRVDGLVQGVPIGAGTHHITLLYHAPGLRAGFAISLGTLLGLLVAMVLSRGRGRGRHTAGDL